MLAGLSDSKTENKMGSQCGPEYSKTGEEWKVLLKKAGRTHCRPDDDQCLYIKR